MKEVIAIIRPRMVSKTKRELEYLGFNGMTALFVLGRGKQRGIMEEVDIDYRPGTAERGLQKPVMYVPKRYLSVVVPDDAADAVVEAIATVNRTGKIGDGRVFVCPVEEALTVRTGATGLDALL